MRITLISVLVLVALGLAGCATPVTILQNRTTGDVVRCGGGSAGSAAGGLLGYSIEKSNDDTCVKNYQASGYVPVSVDGIEVNGGLSKTK